MRSIQWWQHVLLPHSLTHSAAGTRQKSCDTIRPTVQQVMMGLGESFVENVFAICQPSVQISLQGWCERHAAASSLAICAGWVQCVAQEGASAAGLHGACQQMPEGGGEMCQHARHARPSQPCALHGNYSLDTCCTLHAALLHLACCTATPQVLTASLTCHGGCLWAVRLFLACGLSGIRDRGGSGV